MNKRLNKTPYEVFYGIKPRVNFFRTFGCPCIALQTNATSTSKFAEKADECYFVGYAADKSAYRVYNKKTRVILESFNIDWQELNPTDAHNGPNWMFDYESLFKQFRGMYVTPVVPPVSLVVYVPAQPEND
ncbi:uncharacterized protein LOC143630041 [Bidens hawaiensis]|uniref:uncharacterized protein LOC143630041 n=1 Tax=Bidens hawaiensis TaxID=980011 RepID=UPI00404B941A